MNRPSVFRSIIALSMILPSLGHAAARLELNYGQPLGEASSEALNDVPRVNEALKRADRAAYQIFGVAYNGDQPLKINENRLMIPASTMKILTSVTSLRLPQMGPDFKFKNYFDGAIAADNTTLLEPRFSVSGDPTWAHPQYRTHVDEDGYLKSNSFNETLFHRIDIVVAALVAKKIKTVVGPISVASLRPELNLVGRPEGWKDYWKTECMATIPTTVMLNGNCAPLHILSAKDYAWELPGVSTPVELNLKEGTKNSITITPIRDSLFRVVSYTVSGTIKGQYRVNLPVHNNEQWLVNLLLIQLKKAGIAYVPKSDVKNPAMLAFSPHRFVVDLSSAPLKEILKPCLLESINAIADRLFYENGFQAGMDPSMAAFETLRKFNTNVSFTHYELKDGSGLSPLNQVTAEGFLQLLTKIRDTGLMVTMKDKSIAPFFESYVALFPVAGKSGTIQTRLKGETTNGKIFAKTGHIDSISNLMGYYKAPDNTYEPFVVFSVGDGMRLNPGVDKKVLEFAEANNN